VREGAGPRPSRLRSGPAAVRGAPFCDARPHVGYFHANALPLALSADPRPPGAIRMLLDRVRSVPAGWVQGRGVGSGPLVRHNLRRLAAGVFLLAFGCAGTRQGEGVLDPELSRIAAAQPQAVVGVIVQVDGVVGSGERKALVEAGLRIGTVLNGFVTGELPAGRAADVARLRFVRYVELSRDLRPHPDTLGPASES
jgi:hypothetical protein